MKKIRYEVVFSQERWLVMGGDTTEELEILETFSANALNKQRAYEALSVLRIEEKLRRSNEYKGE
jgi:hypothetical protein